MKIENTFNLGAEIVLAEGDCYDSLRQLPDNCIQLIVTSPPYNLGKEYEKSSNLEEYLSSFNPIIDEMFRVLSDNGSLCWQVGNYVKNKEVFPLDIFFYSLFSSRGLRLRNRIIWHFAHGLHSTKRFSGRYEVILWFTKSDEYVFNLDAVRVPSKYPGKRHFKGPNKGLPSGNPLGKNPSDIWSVIQRDWDVGIWDIPNVKSNHPEKTSHPCQFPIEIVERCVLAFTSPGSWVLDPFCGSGTSLLASIVHGRRAMGCEKEPEYIEISTNRIYDYLSGNMKYRPLGKPIHEPSGKEKAVQKPKEWFSFGNGDCI